MHFTHYLAPAVFVSVAMAETKFCGAPNEYEVLMGTPWIVYSMNYNYKSISGSCCTGYAGTSGSGDAQRIQWSSIWDIDPTVNKDVVKGYSFIGLTQNLETRLSDIQSIPSTYSWTVSNSSAYKGISSAIVGHISLAFLANRKSRQRRLRLYDLGHKGRQHVQQCPGAHALAPLRRWTVAHRLG